MSPIIVTHDDLGNLIRQGSSAWWALKVGRPSASNFGRIMMPEKLEYSTGARPYIAQLIGEQILGVPADAALEQEDDRGGAREGNSATTWTERGLVIEPRARLWYEMERGVEVREVALVTSDDGSECASPDGLVGEPGILEVKCFGLKHHMSILVGAEPIVTKPQAQGLLRVTGREWVDCLAYHPTLPKRLTRVFRDETYQEALEKCMVRFKAEMAKAKERLLAAGDAIIDDGLLAQLAASVAHKKRSKAAMTPEEMQELTEILAIAQERGVFDESDIARIVADAQQGKWEDVRNMRAHAQKAIGLEVVK